MEKNLLCGCNSPFINTTLEVMRDEYKNNKDINKLTNRKDTFMIMPCPKCGKEIDFIAILKSENQNINTIL